MVDWNAPNLYYKLWYRKRGSADWLPEKKFTDPSIDKFSVPDPGYYIPWEFQIQAENDQGPGPKSPIVWSYSGQDPPKRKPEDVEVGAVTARSVELSWKPVTVDGGSVDGYRVSWLCCHYNRSLFEWLASRETENIVAWHLENLELTLLLKMMCALPNYKPLLVFELASFDCGAANSSWS